jgi:hypothetical protein
MLGLALTFIKPLASKGRSVKRERFPRHAFMVLDECRTFRSILCIVPAPDAVPYRHGLLLGVVVCMGALRWIARTRCTVR